MQRIGVVSLAVLTAVAAGSADAAVVTPGSPGSGGIVYAWTVSGMTSSDGAQAVRHVGAFSWNDPINFGDPVGTGWTHTSDWLALELTQPALLTVQLERTAGVPNGAGTAGAALYPAFSIYSGWHTSGGDDHVYNNSGPFAWAPDLLFVGNNGNPSGVASVSATFVLAAGDYSIALGGNPPSGVSTSGRQGYTVSLSTSEVPEAGSLALGTAAGAVGLIAAARRRRRAAAEF